MYSLVHLLFAAVVLVIGHIALATMYTDGNELFFIGTAHFSSLAVLSFLAWKPITKSENGQALLSGTQTC